MIFLRLIGLLFDLILLPLRLLVRSRGIKKGTFLTITIDGPVTDVIAPPRFWQIRSQKATSLYTVGEIIDRAAIDPRVRGLVVTLRSFEGGLASATSLRTLLGKMRRAGKEVCVYLPRGGGTKEVYVASVASKLVLGPCAQLSPLGFLSSSRYVRRALERAGIEPEILACGDYKSAGETLVRDEMSAPQREQLEMLLDGFHGTVIAAIAEGRRLTESAAAALVDNAPYFGEAAVEAGLADSVAYEDELAKTLGIDEPHPTRFFLDGGAYLAKKKQRLFRRLTRPPVIAVIPVHGAIAHVPGPFDNFATDERVTRMVRIARLDRRVKGVILHVDSPGGSALASDLMHHEIAMLAREKPVVCCMANVAASGGYYVAAPAHKVVCESTTVTGSIGVVAARLTAEALLARIGVKTEVVRRGRRAELLSPMRPIDEDSRAALQRELEATYKAFVAVVARGRRMKTERVEELARGRVYGGTHALQVGLVDAVGGFPVALAEVRKLIDAGVRDRVEPHVMRTPRRSIPVLDPPSKDAGRKAASLLLGSLLSPHERLLADLCLAKERVLAIAPITET